MLDIMEAILFQSFALKSNMASNVCGDVFSFIFIVNAKGLKPSLGCCFSDAIAISYLHLAIASLAQLQL